MPSFSLSGINHVFAGVGLLVLALLLAINFKRIVNDISNNDRKTLGVGLGWMASYRRVFFAVWFGGLIVGIALFALKALGIIPPSDIPTR